MSYTHNDPLGAIYNNSPAPDAIQGRTLLSHADIMDRFNVSSHGSLHVSSSSNLHGQALVKDLESVLPQLPVQTLAALPPSHDIRQLLREFLFLAASSADRQRTPLLMSQKIVQLLYKTNMQLAREIYVALLDQLCQSFEEVAKEAINWLIYAEDEVRHLLHDDGTHLSVMFAA